MEHKDANSYQAYYNNEPVDTVLSMKVFYGTDNYIGSDGLYTRRLDETCTIKVRYICSTYMGIGIKLRWDSLWGKKWRQLKI